MSAIDQTMELLAEVSKLRGLLKRLEFCRNSSIGPMCPVCEACEHRHGKQEEHAPDCELAEALK